MGIWDLFKKPAADAASTLIGSVTGFIDEVVTNKEEKAQLKMQAEKQLQEYTTKMEELAQSAEKMFIEDKQNARNMQVAALAQNDLFSKRFVYYLSIGLISGALLFDFLLFFKTVPDINRDMINMALGTLNSLGFASVVTFFLGSSKSSQQKTDIITNLSTPTK
jgi:hypothetical protein